MDITFGGLRQRALQASEELGKYYLDAIDKNQSVLATIQTLAVIQIAQELNEIKHTLREQKEPIELRELLLQLIRRQDG